jgi:lysozyme
MKMSSNGLKLLKDWEGQILHVYRDAAGLQTIGIGHLLTASEKKTGLISIAGKKVEYSHGITEQQALDLLAQDVVPAESAVNASVTATINQNQFDALVSFAFNVGCGGFRSSTALRMINTEQFDKVPEWLAKWNKCAGKINDGLVTRRKNEVELFNT